MTPPDDVALSTREVQLLTSARLDAVEKKQDSAILQNERILAILGRMEIQDALGNKRQDDIEKRVDLIEADKRSVAAMITAGVAVVSGLGTLLWEVLSGKHS
jgi:hypothetical protein